MTLAEIKRRLDGFSPTKIHFIANVVDSLANPPQVDIRQENTWLTSSSDWIEYFGLALSIHHGSTTEPLGLTAFETVFRNACESVNWVLDPPGSATRRFVDLEVTPKRGSVRRLSLKSTAAQIVSESTAHISKLTEAAWIQDARTPKDRQSRLQKLFADYHRAVDSIVMLRVFRRDGIPHRYQLIEIPTSLFSSIQDAPLEAFNSDAPIISCEVDGETAAVVAVDRSDAKVTIRRIRLTNCVVHAEWTRT